MANKEEAKKELTTKEFATELGVTVRAIHNACSRGNITPSSRSDYKKSGNMWSRETVEEYKEYLRAYKEIRSRMSKMSFDSVTKEGLAISGRLLRLSDQRGDERLIDTIDWLIQFYYDNK